VRRLAVQPRGHGDEVRVDGKVNQRAGLEAQQRLARVAVLAVLAHRVVHVLVRQRILEFQRGDRDAVEEQPDGENAWFFTALDFVTGKVAYKQFIGLGQKFDINWGSPAIARDGTAYLGILEGIVQIADGSAEGE